MSEPERPAEPSLLPPSSAGQAAPPVADAKSPSVAVEPPAAAEPPAASEPAVAAESPAAAAPATSQGAADAAEPAPPSAFAVWRKRLSPLVLVIAMAFLLREACEGNARRPVTVQLELGAQSARVQQLWVDVFVEGESIAQYQRGALLGTPSFEARLSGDPAELRIELELAPIEPGGEVTRRVITRKLSAKGGSTVTVRLGDELFR